MDNLQIIKSANFGDIKCDIYGSGKEFFMTRAQIGVALEYTDPRKAIKDIHSRHRARLNKYSVALKLATTKVGSNCAPLGGTQNTILYNRKGIMEICRHSDQPKADAFMDWVWDVMDGLISGETELTPKRHKPIDVVFRQRFNIARALVDHIGVKPGVAYALAIDEIEKETGQSFEAYKKMLPVAEHETGYLNASGVGKKIGRGAREVNVLLQNLGLQYKDEKKRWRLTDAGKEYGEEMPYVKNGHSDYQIRWNESISEFLREQAAQ